MTRGGKREGAGRPVGTTKEPTVSLQRRVKPEWIPLIDEFIAKLKDKKLIILLICFIFLAVPCFALTLEGGVTYTEETARVEAFEGVSKYLTFPNKESFRRSLFIGQIDYNNVAKILNYKATYIIKPIKVTGIVYKDEPDKIYGYIHKKNGYQCICVQVIEGAEFPKKTRNYFPKTGELMSIGLVTETQEFKFDTNGKLQGYWENGKLKTLNKTRLKMKLLNVLDSSS